MKNSCSMFRWLCAAVALLTISVSAFAVDIPSSASVGAVPGTPGTGLNGSYWKRDPGSLIQTATTLKDLGYSITQTVPPTATFRSTVVNYTGDDLTPVDTWLGADAASLNPQPLPPVSNLDDGLFTFSGYYAASAGTQNFYLSSDDGSILKIGGVSVVDNDGGHGAPGATPGGSATFTAAGLYPVEIIFFNGDWTDPANPAAHGGANIDWHAGTAATAALVGTASLYQVPEPTSLAFAGLIGMAWLTWVIRRGK